MSSKIADILILIGIIIGIIIATCCALCCGIYMLRRPGGLLDPIRINPTITLQTLSEPPV